LDVIEYHKQKGIFMIKYVLCFILLTTGVCDAQEWISYNPTNFYPVNQRIITSASTVYQQQYQPVVIYQWVPVATYQNYVVEKHCFFHRTQIVTTQPVVQWIYQPVVVYR